VAAGDLTEAVIQVNGGGRLALKGLQSTLNSLQLSLQQLHVA
jgi:hypothetical protein